jgi:DnaJ family protein B protein 4
MGRDYYALLGVPRNASFPDIRAGYKWNSMKWHPQKNPSSKVEAEQRFRDIAEAYDVLINPTRRQRYDELGEQGLKFPAANSGIPPYQYVGDPFALFVEFFSDANPLLPAYDLSLNSNVPASSTKQAEKPIEVEIRCTLAELQDGAIRRVVVERTRIGPNGLPYQESKKITLPISPGWQVGMRVHFRGEGNQTDKDRPPGDLIVVLGQRDFPAKDYGETEIVSETVAAEGIMA